MNLGDFFPDEIKKEFAERNIEIGSALFIKIPEVNNRYPKYIVIVSENEKELLIAYVVINSKINKNVFPTSYLKSLHVKIGSLKNDFLENDSYIDCTKIRTHKKDDIFKFIKKYPEKVCGNIDEETLKKVHNTITIAKTIDKNTKSKFGFI